MKRYLILILTLVATACTATSQPSSQAITTTTVDVVEGMSQQRLLNINKVMQSYVDQNKLAGTVTLVARNGKIVHKSAIGMQNKAQATPMSEDTIFRIYSMTKPVTAVAALTLWEQGKFHMNDPIDMYLPELKDLKVYVSGSGDDMILETAKHPIRIIDLFMHTAGFSYGFTDSEVDNLYRNSPISLGKAVPSIVLSELAKLPLNHQPGTKWHYGVNTDVIGFLVEKLSGKKLGEYMQEVIFDPLNMNDTGFYVKPANMPRFAEIYTAGENGVTIAMPNEPLGDFTSDPAIHNGGGGLTSTIDDYFVFAQMLLNGGQYNGVRILGRKTVEYLSTNHMPDNLVPFSPDSPGEGYGLAMSVTVDESKVNFMGSTGDYGWGGAASTYFRIDPKENMILISMTQFMPYGYHRYMDDYRNLVYQALVD